MRINFDQPAPARRGVILLVVVTMLTLFAVVAVTFVFFSETDAQSARLYKESEVRDRPDPDLLLGFILNRVMYGTNDPDSALVLQSLMENVFDRDSRFVLPQPPPNPAIVIHVPFKGTGKLHQTVPAGTLAGTDAYYLLNYTNRDLQALYFGKAGPPAVPPLLGSFNPPYTYPDQNAPFLGAIGSHPLLVANMNYNLPVILARSFVRLGPPYAQNAATGDLLYFNPYDPNNAAFWTDPRFMDPGFFGNPQFFPPLPPNYTYMPGFTGFNQDQKSAMVLRPIPWKQYLVPDASAPLGFRSLFPGPEDGGGDVKNVFGVRGVWLGGINVQRGGPFFASNDSYWIDPRFPVQRTADGKRYKPLYGVFIKDLNGSLDVNEDFNMLGTKGPPFPPGTPDHVSNLGLGPHEIGPPPPPNPNDAEFFLFSVGDPNQNPIGPPEYLNLLRGALRTLQRNMPPQAGRYGELPGYSGPLPTFRPVAGQPGQQMIPNYPNVWGVAAIPSFPDNFWGPYYSRTDFDAFDPLTGQRTAPPSFVFAPGVAFPTFAAGTDNGRLPPNVRINHPSLYSSLAPYPYDRRFAASDLELLFRMGDTNTDGLTSNIVRLCPATFAAYGINGRLRWMLTTESADRASYGLMPWFDADPTHLLAYDSKNDPYPRGTTVPLPALPPNTGEYDPNNTKRPWLAGPVRTLSRPNGTPLFDGQRLDLLNEPFVPYPDLKQDGTMDINIDIYPPNPQGGPGGNGVPDYLDAQADRQARAKLIYLLLVEATGAFDPSSPNPPANKQHIDALRWLAQLAVNIVDYLDPDDIMTPFNWGSVGSPNFAAALGGEWVFGTELPRLGINEVYARSNPDDPTNPTKYTVDVWAGLHNPQAPVVSPDQASDAPLINGGTARLRIPDPNNPTDPAKDLVKCYKILLEKPNKPTNIRDPNNVTGKPDAVFQTQLMGGQPCEVSDFTATTLKPQPPTDISPSNGAWDGGAPVPDPMDPDYVSYPNGPGRGWYLLGPAGKDIPKDTAMGPPNPKIPKATFQHSRMTYEDQPDQNNNKQPANPVTVVLRRLANPYLPVPANPGAMPPTVAGEDNNPASPTYNPFVTVDYVEQIHLNDANAKQVTAEYSEGKRQPYASYKNIDRQTGTVNAAKSHVVKQAPQPQLTGQPQHTFFRHNSTVNPLAQSAPDATLTNPFDWLVHLDRPLANPMELLYVSAFKPHELTQQFMGDYGQLPQNQQRFQHMAPWFDYSPTNPSSRLYRFLEFVETRPLAQLNPPMRRRPGKININTDWEREILKALVDMPSPLPYPDPVDRIWGVPNGPPGIHEMRDAYQDPIVGLNPMFPVGHPKSQPFWSLSVGPQPNASRNGTQGLNNTWLRDGGTQIQAPAGTTVWGSSAIRAFEPLDPTNNNQPYDHPYARAQVMTKISNNLTTRSNQFAVWVTVGYFEVLQQPANPLIPYDPVTNPMIDKLGQEIGRNDGKHRRHRMFAIMDRSLIEQYQSPAAIANNNLTAVPPPPNPGLNPYGKYDPRNDYSAVVDPLMPDGKGPARTVLHWTVIE